MLHCVNERRHPISVLATRYLRPPILLQVVPEAHLIPAPTLRATTK
jgi:hypothetical protein